MLLIIGSIVALGAAYWMFSGYQTANSERTATDTAAAPSHNGIYLVMVRDTRAGGNAELLNSRSERPSDVGRTDVMVLARLKSGTPIEMVSIPRDTLVDIPACKRSDGSSTEPQYTKINAAYAFGASSDSAAQASPYGIACAEKTVHDLSGISVEGSMVLDSKAIETAIDRLGGVELCASAAHAAAIAGLKEGCHTVDGATAFAFSQARYGIDNESDIARIDRQHMLIEAFAARLSEKRVPWDIPELMDIVHDLGPHITTSEGLISMNNATKALSATRNGSVQAETMPFVPAPDGINVQPAPEAEHTWARLRGEQESRQ
ncbi:LCP family protein [Corynebacterium sp. TAE3-ERU2]|uniref:LCP family protein n=1 Tax=Corynebacterium sp. TAE3-ERU2 TaxID=2849497 RepID=UPI001C44D229|nr:LCP family protein [Corynebacterium sp. TAE3-ERU2]